MSVRSIVIKAVACFAIVLVLGVCAVFLLMPESVEEKSELEVFSLDEKSVEKLIINGDEDFSLYRSEKGWVMEGYESIEVKSTYADTLVKSVCNLTSPMLASESGENPAQFGFDNPKTEIEICTANFTQKLLVGNASGDYYYVKRKNGSEIYLVRHDDLYMVLTDKIKYLDNSVISVEADKVDAISFGDISLAREGDGWMMLKPYNHAADPDKVEALIVDPLALVTGSEIVPRVNVTDSESYTLKIYLTDGSLLAYKICGEYIIPEDGLYAYRAENGALSFLETLSFDIALKYVAPIAINTVAAIDFEWQGAKVQLAIDAPRSEAPIFYKDGAEVSETGFRSFYQSLMGLTFSTEGVAEGDCEYKIVFTKTDTEKYTVEFISASESEFAVKLNGTTNFLINKKAVTDIFSKLKNIQ
ncbi:MAG: DUF4340 domain-containing protein [Clostridia bacterium]|nr:DUF4340 domain-containing protein [Clostridia bacterium]